MNTPSQARHIWSIILARIQSHSPMVSLALEPSKAVLFDGKVLTVEIPEPHMELLGSAKMNGHLSQEAKEAGFPGIQVAFRPYSTGPASPITHPSQSYYLVTDACTGEHLGFPSISLIEAHLKLASIGPEWPAVALLAHRFASSSGWTHFWETKGSPGDMEVKAVKLMQVK